MEEHCKASSSMAVIAIVAETVKHNAAGFNNNVGCPQTSRIDDAFLSRRAICSAARRRRLAQICMR